MALRTNFADLAASDRPRKVLYTGAIDEYFGWRFGALEYRSLRFDHETQAGPFFQPVGTVNFPAEPELLRISEPKHMTGDAAVHTVITREYPQKHVPGVTEAFYPMLRREPDSLMPRYQAAADAASRLGLFRRPACRLSVLQHGSGLCSRADACRPATRECCVSGTARGRSQQPLLPRYRKVFVMAPANLVTGGPEALHQLVDAVRRCGGEAYISYYPRGVRAEIPQDYRCYDVVQADVEDAPGNLVVFPETQPLMGRTFVRAATAMWWLSVDHFLRHPERPDWEEVRRHVNFAQSHYAADLLARYGVKSVPLTDYLNDDFRAAWWAWRRNAIAYNVKSAPEIERLKSLSPELAALTWIELAGMSRAEVREALCKVKVYADFGSHPGTRSHAARGRAVRCVRADQSSWQRQLCRGRAAAHALQA